MLLVYTPMRVWHHKGGVLQIDPKQCVKGVTMVLQCCNSGVTVMLQWCYSDVPMV
jgi:hypothetical protein